MIKKAVMLLFIAILFISIVSAAPPVTTTQQFTTGYIIREPQDNIIKINTGYEFDFHVSNISNGVPKTNSISCDFHLYNQTGQHIYIATDTATSDIYDYEFYVDGGNFSSLGAYYYNIECNSSSLGGYASTVLYVTNTGEANPAENVMLFFFIGFLAILALLTFVLIYSFGHLLKKDFDFNDLAYNWGGYFALLGFYILHNNYFGDSSINSIVDFLVIVCAFTNLLFPIIFLSISMIWNALENGRRESEYG